MTKIVASILSVILVFISGWFAHDYFIKPEIIIKKEIEYKTVWKEKPVTCEQAFDCALSDIIIDTQINKDVLSIFAHDKCKENKKDVFLEVNSANSNWKLGLGIFVAGAVITYIMIKR